MNGRWNVFGQMSMQRGALRLACTMALLLGLTLSPAIAHGATASVSGSQLDYLAASGEVNNVRVSLQSGAYRVSDLGASVAPGSGCAPVNAQTVTCSAAGIASLRIDVGDGNDAATNATKTPSVIEGGDGGDTLLGGDGPSADRVSGEGGNDVIDGNVGPDLVSGGQATTRSRAAASTWTRSPAVPGATQSLPTL